MSKTFMAALLIVLCLGAPAMAQDHRSPEGTWYVKVLWGGFFELSYLQNFTADGRTTLLLPFGGPGANEGDTRVGCMGEWKKRPGPGAKAFDFTTRCLYDQRWDAMYGEIRAVLVFDNSGDRFTARFTYYDWEGGQEGFGGEGVMTAERIVLKPLR
jgi:hypothetical protein